MAVNSWLYAQTRAEPVSATKRIAATSARFSALVLKSTTAHLFHVGDARIYRVRDGALEQLTNDHRLWVSQEQSYLSRALGVSAQLEHRLPVRCGSSRATCSSSPPTACTSS